MGMNGKEFAAHRGVDPSRVSQWRKQGRLVLDAEGKIDAAATSRLLDASLDRAKGVRRGGNITSTVDMSAPAGELPLEVPRGGQPGAGRGEDPEHEREAPVGYWGHKTRQAAADAQLKEMEARKRAGELTSAAEVKKEAAEAARAVRNAILSVPDRIAAVLDPANPARAHKLLTDELQKAIRELSTGLEQRAAASAGAVEREGALL